MKQPGIFLFYLAAGKLFGFSEVGVHALELIYMAAFGWTLVVLLRPYLRNPEVNFLTPIFTVGLYYLVAREWHLTQPESLAGFPLSVCLLCALRGRAPATAPKWLFLSGLSGGLALMYKFAFLPVPAVFWLSIYAEGVAKDKKAWGRLLLRMSVPVAIGGAIPFAALFGYFFLAGELETMIWTLFKFPFLVVSQGQYVFPELLLDGLKWLVKCLDPVAPFAVVGALTAWKRKDKMLPLNLVVWCALGFSIVMIQRRWWEYHYMLIFPPVGMLAALGADSLWGRRKRCDFPFGRAWGRYAAAAAAIALALPALYAPGARAVKLARHGLAISAESRMEFQKELCPRYSKVLEEAAFLSNGDSLPGDIFVFGDPLYFHLTGRGQAIPITGWPIEILLPEQWAELTAELAEARPAYIFIQAKIRFDYIAEQSPATMALIAHEYRLERKTDIGVWYVRADSG
jgi:predicted membrane channel-forming protein YqfA (hemolysin III family)